MRSTALAAAIGSIAACASACTGASARRPAATLASPAAFAPSPGPRVDASDPMPPEDPVPPGRAPAVRVVSAAGIRVVSAAGLPAEGAPAAAGSAPGSPPGSASVSAAAPGSPPCEVDRAGLRAPHRRAEPPPPPLRAPQDLRALVGRRDPRPPLTAITAWSRELGAPIASATGAELVSWAAEAGRLRPASEAPRPGDLLVFDQATSDDPADLVALVIDRDARGVAELLYVAAGVVRRGLVDGSRPTLHRDATGATVNTFLRHGKRWPAKGTRYLAGELLGHVIRPR